MIYFCAACFSVDYTFGVTYKHRRNIMLTFSILTTVAFGLFFVAMIGRIYGGKLLGHKAKGKKIIKSKLIGNKGFCSLITAGIACLIVAVWL